MYNAVFGGDVGCSGVRAACFATPLEYSKMGLQMPFFIFKVWRETRLLERLHTFTDAPLTEADTYRRAEASCASSGVQRTHGAASTCIWSTVRPKRRRVSGC